MSALAIVAICVAATFSYCFLGVYVYMRLLWHYKQNGGYDPALPAFINAVFLPLGLAILLIYSVAPLDRSGGLAPRAIRRERELKRQQAEIDRLERELGIR